MTILAAFNELEGWDTLPASTIASTDTSVAIAGINRAGCQFTGAGRPKGVVNIVSTAEGWLHLRQYSKQDSTAANNQILWALYDSTTPGTPIVSLSKNGDATANNKIVTPWGSSGTLLADNEAHDIDVHWNIASSGGYIRVYRSNLLIFEYTGNTTNAGAFDGVTSFQFGMAIDTADTAYYARCSQIIIATTSTMGGKVYTLAITADGSTSDWEGDVTEIAGTSFSTGGDLQATADEQTHLFDIDTMPALGGGEVIDAVIVSSRAMYTSGATVVNQSAAIKMGATTYETSPVAVNSAQGKVAHIMATAPDGSGAWTVSSINSSEFGIRAEAA